MQGVRLVAVVGTGSAGMRHINALQAVCGVRTLAVPVRQGQVGALRDTGIDAVEGLAEAARQGALLAIIATDTGRHARDALEAMAHGLDVLVEKPLASDAREGQRLLHEAVAAGRRVYVACQLRFAEALHSFRDLLVSIGRLHRVRIESLSYLPEWRPQRPYQQTYSARAAEGGVLRDQIHEVDYAGWLFGWPERVTAKVLNLGRLNIDADEVTELLYTVPGGAAVSIALDYLTRPARRGVYAAGEWGTLECDLLAQRVILTPLEGPPQLRTFSQTFDDMLYAQDRAFLLGGRDRLATLDEGVRTLAVCDAARESSRHGRDVRVAYP